MKMTAPLLIGLSLLMALSSCSGPQAPSAAAATGLVSGPGADSGHADGTETATAETSTRQTNIGGIDTSRLRLPDMESLPSDNELATQRPSPAGGGVIARPPTSH